MGHSQSTLQDDSDDGEQNDDTPTAGAPTNLKQHPIFQSNEAGLYTLPAVAPVQRTYATSPSVLPLRTAYPQGTTFTTSQFHSTGAGLVSFSPYLTTTPTLRYTSTSLVGPSSRIRTGARSSDPDEQWLLEIIDEMWPYIATYVGTILKRTFRNLSLRMKSTWAKQLLPDIDRFTARLSADVITLPPTVSWINNIVEDVWNLIRPVVQAAVKDYVCPLISEKLEGYHPKLKGCLTIPKCEIGNTAPKISAFRTENRTLMTHDGEKEYTHLLLSIQWASDIDIQIQGPFETVKLGIRHVDIATTLHVCLGFMMDEPPFFGGVNVYMANPPKINFDWTGLLDILDCDTVEKLLHDVISDAISGMLVLPNRISVMVGETEDTFRVRYPKPPGIMKITFKKATGLRTDDFAFSTLWTGKRTSDAYVHAVLGATQYKTKVVKGVRDENKHGGFADFDQSFYFIVDEPRDQYFTFSVNDKDLILDEPLAVTKERMSIYDLLGITEAEARSKRLLHSKYQAHKDIQLDVVWAGKAGMSEDNKRRARDRKLIQEAADRERKNAGAESFAQRAMDAAANFTKVAEDFYHKKRDQFREKTGYDTRYWNTLESHLTYTATWLPIETNISFARAIQPGYVKDEKATMLLFVGIYGTYDLPSDDATGEATKYHVECECLPCISWTDGEELTKTTKETKLKTSAVKAPKQKKKIREDDADEKQKQQENIVTLAQNNVPPEIIAEVLEIPLRTVEKFLDKAILDSIDTNDAMCFDQGFYYLLSDLRHPDPVKVKLEVFRNKKTLLGHIEYDVAHLLACKGMKEDLLARPLVLPKGESHSGSISLRFQLRTFCQGKNYPIKDVMEKDEKERQKPRTVFLDKLGRKKVQVDGLWVDEDKEKGMMDKVKDAAVGVVDAVKSSAEAAEHAVAEALDVAETAGEAAVAGTVAGAKLVTTKAKDAIKAVGGGIESAVEAVEEKLSHIFGGEEIPGLRLAVTVHSAGGLTNLDGFLAGVSDPYCQCEVIGEDGNMKGKRFTTKVIDNSLDPAWNETGSVYGFEPGDTLKFTVIDKDTFPKPDQLIGTATVTSETFYPSSMQKKEFKLVGPKEEDAGCLVVTVIPSMSIPVSILSASNLHNHDGFMAGVSDPYCICHLLDLDGNEQGGQLQTQVIDNNLNPNWEFRGTLQGFVPGDDLHFQVWDKDTLGSKKLGRVVIHSERFYPCGLRQSTYELEGHEGSIMIEIGKPIVLGSIASPGRRGNSIESVSGLGDSSPGQAYASAADLAPLSTLDAVPAAADMNADQTRQEVDEPPIRVGVVISRASGLPNKDGLFAGVSDPYCLCHVIGQDGRLKGKKFQTKVVDNCLDPVWDEQGDVYGFEPGDTLEFMVWDKDTFPKPDELLGTAKVSSDQFYPQGTSNLTLDLNGPKADQAGSLVVSITPSLTLPVMIVRATGLPNMDGCLAGTSDPYCVCQVEGHDGKAGGMSFQTKVIDNSTEPVWNEQGKVGFLNGESLEFQVWDKDTFPKPDQRIGTATVHKDNLFNSFGAGLSLELIGPSGDAVGCLEVTIGQPHHRLEVAIPEEFSHKAKSLHKSPPASPPPSEPLPEPRTCASVASVSTEDVQLDDVSSEVRDWRPRRRQLPDPEPEAEGVYTNLEEISSAGDVVEAISNEVPALPLTMREQESTTLPGAYQFVPVAPPQQVPHSPLVPAPQSVATYTAAPQQQMWIQPQPQPRTVAPTVMTAMPPYLRADFTGTEPAVAAYTSAQPAAGAYATAQPAAAAYSAIQPAAVAQPAAAAYNTTKPAAAPRSMSVASTSASFNLASAPSSFARAESSYYYYS